MGDLPFWVKALLAGRFVNALGSMAWVFIPLYLVSDRGLDTPEAGTIAAVYGVGIIGGNLVGGSLGDRFGMRRTLAAASLASAVGCALVPVTTTSGLPVVLGLMGLLGGAARPVSFALVTGALPSDQRRQASALMRAVNNAGTVLGPPVGGLVAAYDFTWIFVGDAVASLLMLAVVLGVVPHVERVPVPEGVPRRVLGALRRDPRFVLLLVSVAVVDTAYRWAYTAVPWQLEELGAEPWVYGTTISLNCALIVLLEPYLAHRLRHREAWRLIAAGFLLVGLGWLVVAPAPGIALVLVAVAVVTAGEMLYKPTATATAADRAPEGMHGRYQSLYGAASLGGMVIAPPLAGALLEWGDRRVWIGGALLGMAGAATLTLLWSRLAPTPADALPTADRLDPV
ncbi:MFS transporter [Nocardioides bigeumensis]|uniref:MFS transporter n=1 Tax=Nocardioides bigeumensis TaxID=433657 RepID=A0ABP5JDF1_9ACTN